MRTSKFMMVFGLLVVASMVLTACGGAGAVQTVEVTRMVEGTPQTVVITATPGAQATGPKILRSGQFGTGDVPTLDPSLGSDTSSIQVIEELTVGLTRQEETTGDLLPAMATSWDTSADGKTITFHLRNDIPWVRWDGSQVVQVMDCDGNPRMVTAQDFMYGLQRTVDPTTASDYAYVLSFAVAGADKFNSGDGTAADVGVAAPDASTLEITFNQAAAYNVNIAGMWIARAEPQWLIEGDDCTEARGDRWVEPGFNQSYGPFALKDWAHDSQLTIVKNPFWPGIDNVPQPMLDEVQFSMLDSETAFAAYEAGDMDFSTVPLSALDRIKADPELSKELYIGPSPCTYYYGFNTKAPVVSDQRVRLALSEAVDRQSLIDNVTKGGQKPARWFSIPGLLVGAPTLDKYPDLGVSYNPDDAKAQLKAYLDETGQTADQLDLTLMFNTSSGHQQIAEAIQQMWKDTLGVNVKLTNQEWKVYLKTINDPVATPQIWRLGWCQDYPDANNFLKEDVGFGGSANPIAGGGLNWDNPKYEDLLTQAAAESDPAKRMDLYSQAEEILVKTDAVMIPIYWYTSINIAKPYVQRTLSVLGDRKSYEKWDITAH
jgi:oligopeptide transport system substrate-binding protein